MTPRKRGRDTSCAVPALPDAHAEIALADPFAEGVVLSGLLHDPKGCAPHMEEMGFSAGDMFTDWHRRLYDVCLYVSNGTRGGPILEATFRELHRRRETLDTGHWRLMANCLVDLWCQDYWFHEMHKWAGVYLELPLSDRAWAAVAAAAKLRHLCSRRQAIWTAQQVIRDALNPTGGPEETDARTEGLGWE